MAMTKLKLYNGALRVIGENSLSTVTDSIESRRVLDEVFDSGGLDYILEQGLWNFAIRSAKLEYSPSVTPAFGYTRAFEKPTDLIRLVNISASEFYQPPLLQYDDEVEYWFCGLDDLYIRYVSNSTSYGYDYSLWPETFSRYAEAWFASQVCERLTQNATKAEAIEKKTKKLLNDARSKDAMKDPTRFLPSGRWTNSRGGGGGGDMGSRGSLIG